MSSFKVFANGDNTTNGVRDFAGFRLFAKSAGDGAWQQVDTFTPVHPYKYELDLPAGLLHSRTFDKPITGQYFRAEFDQHDDPANPGFAPRIVELDGFGKTLDQ